MTNRSRVLVKLALAVILAVGAAGDAEASVVKMIDKLSAEKVSKLLRLTAKATEASPNARMFTPAERLERMAEDPIYRKSALAEIKDPVLRQRLEEDWRVAVDKPHYAKRLERQIKVMRVVESKYIVEKIPKVI